MAAIVRSWMRAWCAQCQDKRVFELKAGWVLECRECGAEHTIAGKGLVALAG